MGVAAAMYSLDVFAANQLGDDEESVDQGVDIQQECESDSRTPRIVLTSQSPESTLPTMRPTMPFKRTSPPSCFR